MNFLRTLSQLADIAEQRNVPLTMTPVEARDLVIAFEKLAAEIKRISDINATYEKWHHENAGVLASHRIGGYRFDD